MKFETITIDQQDAVWLITLDRQDRLNAINQTMLSEIETACDLIEADCSCRAVVLTGAGRAFSPGFDLQDQATNTPNGIEEWRPILQRDFDGVIRFWNLKKTNNRRC